MCQMCELAAWMDESAASAPAFAAAGEATPPHPEPETDLRQGFDPDTRGRDKEVEGRARRLRCAEVAPES